MAKPIHGCVVCIFQVHPLTSPWPTLYVHAEPIPQDIARCDIKKLKVLQHVYVLLFSKGLSKIVGTPEELSAVMC